MVFVWNMSIFYLSLNNILTSKNKEGESEGYMKDWFAWIFFLVKTCKNFHHLTIYYLYYVP